MEYLVGLFLSIAVAGVAAHFGLDRGKGFFPTVLIVVASYYPLFAVLGGTGKALGLEVVAGVGFAALAIIGFQRNLWLVAGSIAGHGVFDAIHHLFIENAGVPIWWPGFCGTVDILLGGWFAIILWHRSRAAKKFAEITLDVTVW